MQAEREAALIPAGMRIFPEEERVEMLEALAATRSELEKQVQACTLGHPPPPLPTSTRFFPFFQGFELSLRRGQLEMQIQDS